MKKATKLKAFMLSLTMTALLLPMTSFAQSSDDFFRVGDEFNGNRDVVAWTITNNGIGQSEAPVGSGLLVLGAIGAGYAIAKHKRNKKGAALLLALALTLGFTQCKKKVVEPIANNGNTVHITLTMADGGSKVDVNPTGSGTYATVAFEKDDIIYVGNGNKYVGYVTYNGTDTWEGDLTSPTTDDYLHLYFLGNKAPLSDVTPGTTTEFSVSIADQASKYPVISYNHTLEKYNGAGSYTATTLYNKCSIMKFNVATGTNYANDPIRITGMHNKVTVDFATPEASENGFSYSVNSTDGGLIKMPAKDASNITWAIVLPQEALAAADDAVYTNGYKGNRPAIAAIARNTYYNSGVGLTITTEDASKIKDLSTVTADWTAEDGWTLTGTLDVEHYPVKITIADGAMVTLKNATINGVNDGDKYKWAGLTCLGDATIILKDGTTNNVKGFHEDYPGIYVPAGSTLIIKGETSGTGILNASSNDDTNNSGAGIGGGWNLACGNIEIQGGVITATGSTSAAGIGSNNRACGNITISGGTVNATGTGYAAGIGGGFGGGCGDITIASTVTRVTATKGDGADHSIGRGRTGSIGTVTIGGVVGAITESPYTYPAPAPSAPTGAINGLFSVSATKQVYFSQGNLQATYDGISWSWAFATNQWDCILNNEGNTKITNTPPYVSGYSGSSTTVDLFCWVGASSELTGVAQYGITSSSVTNDFGSSNSEALKSDWGNTIEGDWRTLTRDEWDYLLNTRTGATVPLMDNPESYMNGRYRTALINSDVDYGVQGFILFPDGGVFSEGEATRWSYWEDYQIVCTTAQWEALAAKGCVFLPSARYRPNQDNTPYVWPGWSTYYWTSTPADLGHHWQAYCVVLRSREATLDDTEVSGYRNYGMSVRLVKDAN